MKQTHGKTAPVGTMIACLGLAHLAPPEASNPATEALVRQVALEAERIRESLEHAERITDYAPLLERKLTVDGSLLAALLFEDAAELCQAVAAGREPRGPLRALCVEFGDEGLHAEWSHPSGAAMVAQAIGSWAAAPGGVAACRAASASLHAPPGEQAPWIAWTVLAEGDTPGPRMSATAHWYEPCLETTRLDWPLEPRGLHLGWNEAGAWLRTDDGHSWTESWPVRALFNNPPELYAVFDSLRWRRAGDADTTPAPSPAAATVSEPGRITRTLRRSDGSLVRREHWHWNEGALVRLHIEQPPLRLVHHAPHAFDLQQQVDGQPPAASDVVHPSAELAHPAGGLTVEVTFRSPTPQRDAVEDASPGATVPDRVALLCDGVPRALVEIRGVASGHTPAGRTRALRTLESWQFDETTSMRHRQRMAVDTLAACAGGDATTVHAQCQALGALAQADGVAPAWITENRRIAQRHLAETGFDTQAVALAVWNSDDSAPPTSGDALALDQLGDEHRALLAAWQRAMASVARANAARASAARANPARAALHTTHSSDAEQASRRAREIRQQADRRAAEATAAARDAVAAEVQANPDVLRSHAPLLSTRLEADALALAAAGMMEDDVHAWARALGQALRQPPIAESQRTASRAALRRLAHVGAGVARRRMLECGSTAAEAADTERRTRDRLMAYEGLAGNCLRPEAVGTWVADATEAEMAEAIGDSPLVRSARPLPTHHVLQLPEDKRLDPVAMAVVAAAWQCLSREAAPTSTSQPATEPNGPPKRPPSDPSPPPPRPKPPGGAHSAAGTQSQRPARERAPEGTRRDTCTVQLPREAASDKRAKGRSVPAQLATGFSSVIRPMGTHSATRMLPSASQMASCGWTNLPGMNPLRSAPRSALG